MTRRQSEKRLAVWSELRHSLAHPSEIFQISQNFWGRGADLFKFQSQIYSILQFFKMHL